MRSILEDRPQLINAEYAINEGGGLVLDNNGKMQYLGLQAAEKIYHDFSITAKGPTGHSSIPKDGNAIDRLARALVKVASAQEPPRLIPITRAFFEASAALEEPSLADAMRKLARTKGSLPKNALAIVAKKPELIAMLRTTCIPTLIEGGTRANALPAKATANVNCRILPDSTPDQARARLISAIGDAGIEVQNKDEDGIEGTAAPSSMTGEFMDAVRRVTSTSYPGLPIIPSLVSGATDSRFLRAKGIQAYGLSPLASSLEDASRDHGVDERIRVSSIRPGIEYMYKLVSTIAR